MEQRFNLSHPWLDSLGSVVASLRRLGHGAGWQCVQARLGSRDAFQNVLLHRDHGATTVCQVSQRGAPWGDHGTAEDDRGANAGRRRKSELEPELELELYLEVDLELELEPKLALGAGRG